MSSELVDLCAYMCDETKQPGLITTEEEFKKMENAVNNLLITKKQIDSLSNERNSLMLLYENKINEQNSQIKYLEEENYFLKLKLEQQNSTDGEQWRQKYEQSLDNIMRQLLSSLKTQETIRAEFMNLDQADNELDSLISTSNSWTFKGLNLNKSHRVQELLMLQQKQQLNLLNELSEISKSLKTNCHSQHTNHSSCID
ncbi:Nck-associated 5 [Brachionus plicatilis]|uniref:Nck-associated 5 n=1 Tax=Brachionus plicatilis TaxID=10195 RepID=A0A3M7P8Q8_BRAPC|nr:Nck-associated 5 [Brachionus plicatilis]